MLFAKRRGLRVAVWIGLGLAAVSACVPARGGAGAVLRASPVPTTAGEGSLDASHPVGGQQGATLQQLTFKSVDQDPLPNNPQLAAAVRQGSQIFRETGKYASQYVGNGLACTNCHIAGGQKEGALPLVGIGAQFPAYSPRDGRLISLEDRIRSCFARSEAGTAPPYDSPELLAVAAYLTWISADQPLGVSPPWRGKNVIAQANLIPIDKLQPARGGTLFAEKCAVCHGQDGQGGAGPPVWGPRSFNDGAGTARVYTLAGFIRYAMPIGAAGSLTDGEAQQIAAFIDSHDRPAYAGKDKDYTQAPVPVDAVYYPRRYPRNPLRP